MNDSRFDPPHRSPRLFLRLLVLSGLVGALVGLLIWLGDIRSSLGVGVAVAAWCGLWIFLASDLLLTLAAPWLRQLKEGALRLALTGLFFVAGVFGWQLAALTVPLASGGRWHLAAFDWPVAIAFAGGIGALVGFVLFFVERLRERLAASVARIKEQEFAERELATAREIQQRLLPPPELAGPGFRLAARNLPASVVAGDFYDYFALGDGTLGLAVGDVAGKGTGASLLMASVKAMLPLVAAGRGAAATLAELNRRLAPQLGARQFVALCFVRFDPATGEVELANAGLPDPCLLAEGAAPRAVAVCGPRLPLGLRPEVPYEVATARMAPGERLFLFTDGLAEARTEGGEPLGYAALEALLADLAGPPGAALSDLVARIERATRSPREDDWTALLCERLAAEA